MKATTWNLPSFSRTLHFTPGPSFAALHLAAAASATCRVRKKTTPSSSFGQSLILASCSGSVAQLSRDASRAQFSDTCRLRFASRAADRRTAAAVARHRCDGQGRGRSADRSAYARRPRNGFRPRLPASRTWWGCSRGESIRSQLAVFLHHKHSRTADPLGDPREMKEPDSLGG